MKKLFRKVFGLYKENAHVVVKFLGIKFTFKWFLINQLEDCCCIPNLDYLKSQNTGFAHPIGIVIHPDIKIGKNCKIYQNVTIGYGSNTSGVPIIGDNVTIYANAAVFGNIKIGNNVKIGAGAVVFQDVPDNATVVGNPAKIILSK